MHVLARLLDQGIDLLVQVGRWPLVSWVVSFWPLAVALVGGVLLVAARVRLDDWRLPIAHNLNYN